MISGITVLNEYKDMSNIATIILLILLLLVAITLFVLAVKYQEDTLFLCSLIVCVFFMTIVFEKVSFKTPMIYEVTIDESVGFIEFTNKYEIIEQKYNVYVKDNVYVIKEK